MVPVTVFLLVIITVMGGPTAFVNTLSLWVTDTITYVANWLKYV